MLRLRAGALAALAALAALMASACGRSYVEGDITYAAPMTAKGPRPQTLDLQVPAGVGPFPAVVFIHGGAWVVGDLGRYTAAIERAADRGFVGIAINYRRADEDDGSGHALSPWPAQLADVRCALRWVATHAATYQIDPARVAVVGESAGGHLAMMAGYAAHEPGFEPDDCAPGATLAVQAAVSIYGINDLRAVYESTEWWLKPYITRWLRLPDGASVTAYADQLAAASPISYLGSGPALPSHIIQGTADTLVPPHTQRGFVAAGQAAGQDVTIEYLPGVGHDASVVNRSADLALDWLAPRLP